MDLAKDDRAKFVRDQFTRTLPADMAERVARVLAEHQGIDRYLELGAANPFPGDKHFCAAWLAEIHRQEGLKA